MTLTIVGVEKEGDPELMFQRLSVSNSMRSENDFRTAFDLVLSCTAHSLFYNKHLLLTGTKSELVDAIWKLLGLHKNPALVHNEYLSSDAKKISDGRSILYRIPWLKKHMRWKELFYRYYRYMRRVYGQSSVIYYDHTT